ncbi:hypothetical protein M1M07_00510 [Rhodococcus sp. HM1]|uniref:DUF6636 domain-containing protein n=1 Tax=Rhodococcus sp. HM1 TaxID=2937759 RepID=UPI00200B6830|nr:DUF6636 domain-containing protein [Rhodococcus sp. HM1]MCK8669597.1 hypothetical protein [Rhodococcus sp. HM1]
MNVRRVTSIGVVTVAGLLLAGCGSTDESTQTESVAAAPTTTTSTPAPTTTTVAPVTTTTEPVTTTVATTEPEAPTSLVDVPYERNESYYFTSPDGQFHCGIVKLPTRTEAGCEGTTDPVPPRPDDCVVNWGNGIRVANEGEGAFMCSGGPVYLSDGDTAVLPAGATLSKLGYSCTTTETDVTCVNDGTGHGFTVAAGSNETF